MTPIYTDCPTPHRHLQIGLRQATWQDAERQHLAGCERCRAIQLQLLRGAKPIVRGLIADDSPDARRFIALALKKLNVQVISAGDGDEAVRLAIEALEKNEPFDFFLLDFKMPTLDGCSVAKALRATEGYQCPPMMILTEWTENEELQSQCRENQFSLFSKNRMNRVRLACHVEMALAGAAPQTALAG